jgi:hypothetical protein
VIRRIPKRDPIAAGQRKATAARRVGVNARCACGESRPEALITKCKPIICAECKRKKEGKTMIDKHHVAGKANSRVTIPVPTNDHRARLSSDQEDWPAKTQENPSASPLLAAAGCIRGFTDTAIYLIESLLHWIAGMLELLDSYLEQRLGSRWWRDTDVERLAERRNSHAGL